MINWYNEVSRNLDKIPDCISYFDKELVEAKELESQEKINEEFGDLVFSIVNLGRHLGVDSEEALKQTNRKFINRFKFVEDTIRSQGGKIENTTLEEMETLWQQAKQS